MKIPWRTAFIAGIGLLTCSAGATSWSAEPEVSPPSFLSGWTSAGSDLHDSYSQPGELVLNRRTVARLAKRWALSTEGSIVTTPAVVGSDLYVPDTKGWLYRINAYTGEILWKKKVSDYSGSEASYSRTTPAISGNMLVIGDRTAGAIYGINRSSGQLIWRQLLDNTAGALITGSAVIAQDRVYVGVSSQQESLAWKKNYILTFRGQVAALDLHTGAIVWQFRTVPKGYTGGAVWSSTQAIDLQHNSLYVTVGNNYAVPVPVSTCQHEAKSLAAQLACASPDDHYDSMLALNLADGKLRWSRILQGPDAWTIDCAIKMPVGVACPPPVGPDYDFGSGPNLYTVGFGRKARQVVGAGQKSGAYWELDATDGQTVWARQVGPGGPLGGIVWGTATDGVQVYSGIGNSNHVLTHLVPSNKAVTGGFWSAMNAATGKILWQTQAIGFDPAVPGKTATAAGAVSTAGSVVYGEDDAGHFVALDAVDGSILWKFRSGGSPSAAPAIVDGSLYWSTTGVSGTSKLYAFSLPGSL